MYLASLCALGQLGGAGGAPAHLGRGAAISGRRDQRAQPACERRHRSVGTKAAAHSSPGRGEAELSGNRNGSTRAGGDGGAAVCGSDGVGVRTSRHAAGATKTRRKT